MATTTKNPASKLSRTQREALVASHEAGRHAARPSKGCVACQMEALLGTVSPLDGQSIAERLPALERAAYEAKYDPADDTLTCVECGAVRPRSMILFRDDVPTCRDGCVRDDDELAGRLDAMRDDRGLLPGEDYSLEPRTDAERAQYEADVAEQDRLAAVTDVAGVVLGETPEQTDARLAAEQALRACPHCGEVANIGMVWVEGADPKGWKCYGCGWGLPDGTELLAPRGTDEGNTDRRSQGTVARKVRAAATPRVATASEPAKGRIVYTNCNVRGREWIRSHTCPKCWRAYRAGTIPAPAHVVARQFS